MSKRILSALLCFLVVLSIVPNQNVTAKSISAVEMKQKFEELKREYPTGYIWKDGYWFNRYNHGPGYDGSWQCFGFARLVFNRLFDESERNAYMHRNIDNLCVGDHVRYRATSTLDHSIIVTNIVGDKVYYVDCNGSDQYGRNWVHCIVRWDKWYSKSQIKNLINKDLYDEGMKGYIKTQKDNWVTTLDVISVPPSPNNVNISASNIAVGNTITATWSGVSGASGYKAELVCHSDSAYNRSVTVTGTSASFILPVSGTYSINVYAYNSAGTSGAKTSAKCYAHAPVTVTFVDYDNKVLNTQSVKYGESAVSPAAPSRDGYTFQGWDRGFQGVTQNITVKATYKINVYNVVFKDSNGRELSSQKIKHGEAAKAPTPSAPPSGYVFVGWNYPDFNCVKENMVITAVYAWKNKDLPIVTEIATAKRKTDYSGYDIVVSTKNFPDNITKAKIIVSLKTEENKMVASEMKQVYLNKGETTTHNLFVAYEGVATVAEATVVGLIDNDKTGVPFSVFGKKEVDLGLAWSSWNTSAPQNPNGDLIVESRNEYRYSDKSFNTGTSSTMAGYTLYNTTSTWGSWSGWSRNAVSGSSTRQVNTRTIPATYQTRYTYDRYINSAGNMSTPWSGVYPNYQKIDIDYRLTNYGDYNGNGNRYGNYVYGGNTYLQKMWWHESSYQKQLTAAYNEYQYRDLKYTYHFYKWGTWSNWSTQKYTASNDRKVESRTTYRYKSKSIKTPIYNYKRYKYTNPTTNTVIYTYDTTYPDSMGYSGSWEYTESESELKVVSTVDYNVKLYNGYKGDSWYSADVNKQGEKSSYVTYKTLEDTSGEVYTISGKVTESGSGVNGKQATLLVYKGKNSDPTATQLEAISQTTLTNEGKYTFTFKTKEKPTVETGDFILMLGVEGATKPIYIDTIKAPTPEYKVVFVDGNKVLSEQIVKEGESAKAPENTEKAGYTFVGWDTGLSNVHDDLTVTANYEKKQYSVIFVDWNNNDIAIKTFGYGDTIQVPEPKNIEGYHFTKWKDIVDGETKVTDNMVIMAEYEPNQYTVRFMNWDNTLIKEEKVSHGNTVDIPENIPEKDGVVFMGWNNSADLYAVKTDLTLYPMFAYIETTELPEVNISGGDVSRGEKISLSCANKNAKIYYSIQPFNNINGENLTDVANFTYKEYTEPININDSSTVIFYAEESGKNMSGYVMESYKVINSLSTNTTFKDSGSKLKFYVTCNENVENAIIIVATYDIKGRLLGLDRQECDDVDEYILSVNKTGNEKYAKIMIWEDISGMKPIYNPEFVSL